MKKNVLRLSALAALAAWALCLSAGPEASAPPEDRTHGFFPVSVWYAGGKARAPMLELVTPRSREAWRADLEQIKRLGFNTVSGRPASRRRENSTSAPSAW